MNVVQKQKKLLGLKQELGQLEKTVSHMVIMMCVQLKELEFSWGHLDPSDKAHYRQKVK